MLSVLFALLLCTGSALPQATKIPTSTTITSSLNPSVYGQGVTFTATVTSSSGGTPSGTVTFKYGTTPMGTVALTAGVATLSTPTLVAGTRMITAVYSGSATFAASTSPALSQVIQKLATRTTLLSSLNPSPGGQPVTFTATVTSSLGVPSGKVSFTDGWNALADVIVSGGVASFTTNSLAAGTHTIRATYNGAANYKASLANISQVVTSPAAKSPTSTTIVSSVNPAVYGQTVSFTAKVTSSGAGTPTGAVSFADGTTTIGTVALASGTAVLSTTTLVTGTHTISANYFGDSSFAGSTSPTLSQIVQPAATQTTLLSSLNPSQTGQPVTFTATVASSAGTPGGNISFTDGATALANVALSGGTASFTTSALTIGTHSIAAAYSGDSNYLTSSASLNQTVSQAPGTAPSTPTRLRVDISVGTTGQLYVTWDNMSGTTYYNLQRSADPTSGYAMVDACSGPTNSKKTGTFTGKQACRDGGLPIDTKLYYQVQACNASACSPFSQAVANTAVTSDCTAEQMPDVSTARSNPMVRVPSSTVDPNVTFQRDRYEMALYAAAGVPRRDLLVVSLPGSASSCSIGAFEHTAEYLGFDVMCVNYSNLASQIDICNGDADCFGYVSQAKLDATGPCSLANGSPCGHDPTTGQPYVNSNPSDAISQRISAMLQYLNNKGYNAYGTNWGSYLAEDMSPRWDRIVMSGFSQGGAMATFAGYQHLVSRVVNLSAPLQATNVNNVMTAATYFSGPKATDIRNFYGYVSVNDLYYQQGRYAAVWEPLGFTEANNDAEVRLNTSTPVGLNCNSGIPSHNFSTSGLVSPGGGHSDTLPLWNEDIFKFMLID